MAFTDAGSGVHAVTGSRSSRMGFPPPVDSDGWIGCCRRHHHVHDVGMVDWRDDRRSRYGVQRRRVNRYQVAPADLRARCAKGKLDEATKVADRYKKSHLAKVVV